MNFTTNLKSNQRNYWLDSSMLLVFAAFIGLSTGFAAIGFKMLIGIFETGFFCGTENILGSFLGQYYIVIIPALGGLSVGLIIYFFARETGGYGVADVMAAVDKDAILNPRAMMVKTLA